MKKTKTLALFALAVLLVLAFGACAGSDDSAIGVDDYKNAVPDSSMLAVTLDEDGAPAARLLGAEETAVPEEAELLREKTKTFMAAIHALLKETLDKIKTLQDSGVPVDVTGEDFVIPEGNGEDHGMGGNGMAGAKSFIKGLSCKRWEADIDGVTWQLTSCFKGREGRVNHFVYAMRGRPAASTDDADYSLVFAGNGKLAPKFDGARRGHGFIAFQFDNLKSLTGENVAGRLGIGYRAVGRVRQMQLGLRDVATGAIPGPVSARYHFKHIVGVGGIFRYATEDDFLARDENEALVRGTDGVDEFGRIAIGWKQRGSMRVALLACGGTVGENLCQRYVECYAADGTVNFQDVLADETNWQPAECGEELPFDGRELEPPADDDVKPPSASDEVCGAPLLDEPDPSTAE